MRKRKAARIAAKGGSRAVPGVSQAMMVMDGAPVATDALKRTGSVWYEGAQRQYRSGQRAATAAREGRWRDAATSGGETAFAGLQNAFRTQWELIKGTARTALAAIVAREAAEATHSKRNPQGYLSEEEAVLLLQSVNCQLPSEAMRELARLCVEKGVKGKTQKWMCVMQTLGEDNPVIVQAQRDLQWAVSRAKANPEPAVPFYQNILAYLRALQWGYTTAHWQTKGPQFYGDHLLFERLYTGKKGGPNIAEEMDSYAERLVSLFGPSIVDPAAIEHKVHLLTERARRLRGKQMLLYLLALEEYLQKEITYAWKHNQNSPQMSLGLDDELASLANERMTAIYLLQQRLSE